MRPFDPKTYLVDVLSPYVGPSGDRSPGPVRSLPARAGRQRRRRDRVAHGRRQGAVGQATRARRSTDSSSARCRTQHLEAELTLCDPGERSRLAKKAAERDRDRTKKAADALASWRGLLAEHVKAKQRARSRRGAASSSGWPPSRVSTWRSSSASSTAPRSRRCRTCSSRLAGSGCARRCRSLHRRLASRGCR